MTEISIASDRSGISVGTVTDQSIISLLSHLTNVLAVRFALCLVLMHDLRMCKNYTNPSVDDINAL